MSSGDRGATRSVERWRTRSNRSGMAALTGAARGGVMDDVMGDGPSHGQRVGPAYRTCSAHGRIKFVWGRVRNCAKLRYPPQWAKARHVSAAKTGCRATAPRARRPVFWRSGSLVCPVPRCRHRPAFRHGTARQKRRRPGSRSTAPLSSHAKTTDRTRPPRHRWPPTLPR